LHKCFFKKRSLLKEGSRAAARRGILLEGFFYNEENPMADLIYLVLIILFFIVCFGLLGFFELLSRNFQ
jgi:hypothetical protein